MMFLSYEFYGCTGTHVRPIVILDSDVKITGIGENIGSVDNMWNLTK